MKNKSCKHGKQKGHCRKCNPKKFCAHEVHRSHCRVCSPRGWASGILSVARGAAHRRNYAAPQITPEDLVRLMSKSDECVMCGSGLVWTKPRPHLHHDHKTGEVKGFSHPNCNFAEGMLSKMSDVERKTFIREVFPEVLAQ